MYNLRLKQIITVIKVRSKIRVKTILMINAVIRNTNSKKKQTNKINSFGMQK